MLAGEATVARTARPDDPHANPGFAFVVKSISPAQAEATSQSRVGATLPELPGGHGVWAEKGSAPAGATEVWHRAERPGVIDVAGPKDHEIQASLQD